MQIPGYDARFFARFPVVMPGPVRLNARLVDALSASNRRRGQRLHAGGAVSNLRLGQVDELTIVTGHVTETGGSSARVYLMVDDDHLEADCSCDAGRDCVHIAATLMAAMSPGGDHAGKVSDRSRMPLKQSAATASDGQYMAYLLRLSGDDTELNVCPSRVSRSPEGVTATPFSLSRLADTRQPDYISESDLAILHALADHVLSQQDLVWYPLARTSSGLLRDIIATGRCHWQEVDGIVLSMADSLVAEVRWDIQPSGWQQLVWRVEEKPQDRQLPLLPPWLLDLQTGQCRVMEAGVGEDLAARLLRAGPVAPHDVERVIELLVQAPADFPRPRRLKVERPEFQPPRAKLVLRSIRVGRASGFVATPAARLAFSYGEVELEWDDEHASRHVADDRVVEVERDRKFEAKCLRVLERAGLAPINTCAGRDHEPGEGGLWVAADELRSQSVWVAFQQGLGRGQSSNWEIVFEADFTPHLIDPERWYGDLAETGIDSVALDLGIIHRGKRYSLLPALLAWLEQAPQALLRQLLSDSHPDGAVIMNVDERHVVQVPMARLSASLRALTDCLDGAPALTEARLELPRGRLAELGAAQEEWEFETGTGLAELSRRLRDFDSIDVLESPPGFRASLRDYQRYGLGWLQFLREFGFGGILADDMGLGKTIQTLAHVLMEKQAGRLDRPCLVIAPTSLLFNWRAEASRFAPDLNVLVLHGPRRKEAFGWIGHSDLVLTSYPLLLRDAERLMRQDWHLLILDEAQAIKNPLARVSRMVREFSARHRLCLTGTPLENHLGELWSLFDFLMPGLLGSKTDFRRRFRLPVERHDDTERRAVLARRIRPFFLRRTKEQVAPELPAKTEISRTVVLASSQQRLYERLRVMLHEQVRQALAARGAERSRIVVLDALLKLRQVCCDPRLLKGVEGAAQAGSAKLDLLMDLLPELVVEGRRVLLFSQFTSMLALIEQAVTDAGIEYVKLTGKTRNRQAMVEAFQSGQVPLFLISLKAGGVGLNLTAADTVIHYDPWWNPAVEDQATDRAHRLGQSQKVFVYRLLTHDTVEQKVADMQQSKRGLVEGLLGPGGASSLKAEDLEALFEPLGDEL